MELSAQRLDIRQSIPAVNQVLVCTGLCPLSESDCPKLVEDVIEDVTISRENVDFLLWMCVINF